MDLDDIELEATRWLYGIEPEEGSEWYKILQREKETKNGKSGEKDN